MAPKGNRGLTLIELMIALAISAFLIGAIYRTVISQQKTYTVQEQVVEMQQNVRVSLSRMMDEIRMAGFGNISTLLPLSLGGRNFANIVNPDVPAPGDLTIVSAIGGSATITEISSQNQLVLSRLEDDQERPLFDKDKRRYISVGGIESHAIASIDPDTKTVTLDGPLRHHHIANRSLVFAIRAVTYRRADDGTLQRDENLSEDPEDPEGPKPLADHIENLRFEYRDAGGNTVVNPQAVRIVRLTITARTDRPDPELQDGDGHRTRQIASSIYLRNMVVSP